MCFFNLRGRINIIILLSGNLNNYNIYNSHNKLCRLLCWNWKHLLRIFKYFFSSGQVTNNRASNVNRTHFILRRLKRSFRLKPKTNNFEILIKSRYVRSKYIQKKHFISAFLVIVVHFLRYTLILLTDI